MKKVERRLLTRVLRAPGRAQNDDLEHPWSIVSAFSHLMNGRVCAIKAHD